MVSLSKKEKLKRRREQASRLIVGLVVFALGLIFMTLPFIPLGYIFLIVGLLILSPVIPFLRRLIEWLKRKDRKGLVEKSEHKADELLSLPKKTKKKLNKKNK